MRNFDPKWRDFPDFVISITKEIREDRQISLLDTACVPGIVPRGAGGPVGLTRSRAGFAHDAGLPGGARCRFVIARKSGIRRSGKSPKVCGKAINVRLRSSPKYVP